MPCWLWLFNRFDRSEYQVEISEKADVDSVLTPDGGVVRATDEDMTSRMVYSLTGVYPAEEFFSVNGESAEIRLIDDLRSDITRSHQYLLHISAHDATYPSNQATATVTINVERNPSAPVFAPGEYRVTIDEKHGLGEDVIALAATDDDQVCCQCAL